MSEELQLKRGFFRRGFVSEEEGGGRESGDQGQVGQLEDPAEELAVGVRRGASQDVRRKDQN